MRPALFDRASRITRLKSIRAYLFVRNHGVSLPCIKFERKFRFGYLFNYLRARL